MKELITKKDLLYWLIIVSVILVIVFAYQFGDDKDLVSYFSFAGTISAIILAVIAIIYTLVQNIVSISSVQKITDSVNTLEVITDKVDSSVDTFVEIKEDINTQINRLEEVVSERFKESNLEIKKLKSSFEKKIKHETDPESKSSELGKRHLSFAIELFEINTDDVKKLFYFLLKCSELKITVDLSTLDDIFGSFEDMWGVYKHAVAMTYLKLLHQFESFKMAMEGDDYIITWFDDELKKVVLDDYEKNKDYYKTVDDYMHRLE